MSNKDSNRERNPERKEKKKFHPTLQGCELNHCISATRLVWNQRVGNDTLFKSMSGGDPVAVWAHIEWATAHTVMSPMLEF